MCGGDSTKLQCGKDGSVSAAGLMMRRKVDNEEKRDDTPVGRYTCAVVWITATAVGLVQAARLTPTSTSRATAEMLSTS